MEKDNARVKIEELRKLIEYHRARYYLDDAPEISDFEFDALMRELETLEKEFPEFDSADSPSKKVGGAASEKFEKVRHAIPMGSLTDVFSREELCAFLQRTEKELSYTPEYVVECKIDGLSVELEYENGVFVRGATRGEVSSAKISPKIFSLSTISPKSSTKIYRIFA